MADVTPVPAPGKASSEYALSKAVVVLSSVISVLGTILTVLAPVAAVVPATAGPLGLGLAIGGAVVAGLKAMAYEAQRTAIKVAAIQAGKPVPADAGTADAAAAELGAVKAG